MFLNWNLFMTIIAFIINSGWEIRVTELWTLRLALTFSLRPLAAQEFFSVETSTGAYSCVQDTSGLTHIFSESPVGMWCDYANPQRRGCGDVNAMSWAPQSLVSTWRCCLGRRLQGYVTGGWLWELFWLFSLSHACSNLELWAKISPILHQGGGSASSQPPVPAALPLLWHHGLFWSLSWKWTLSSLSCFGHGIFSTAKEKSVIGLA